MLTKDDKADLVKAIEEMRHQISTQSNAHFKWLIGIIFMLTAVALLIIKIGN
jgi:hypothetical protein